VPQHTSSSDPSRPQAPDRLPVGLLAGLFLSMLAVRPPLLAIGPLLPRIQDDLAISHAEVALLTTIPVVCMGVFAPLGPRLAGRIGARRAVAVCLLIIAIFAVLRAVAPGAVPVIALTVPVGLGMGMVGALPAIVIKQRVPRIPGLATGAYSMGIVTGATVAAGVAVPLSLALGGWREALIALGLAGLVSIVAWLLLVPADARAAADAARPPRLPWKSRTGWLLILVFGLQSTLYYGVVSWLPDAYVERGWSLADAGNVIALMHLTGLAAGLAVPWLADRYGTRRDQLTAVAVVSTAGLAGVVLAPDAAFLWALLLGIGLGAIFPLVLILPVDVADRAADVGAAAALMLLGGYLISGVAPLVLGLARDATGDFSTSLWLLVVIGVVLVGCTRVLSPGRLHRGTRPVAA
jgi:CP family cyanate transporter-like MFS transporter